MSLKVRFESSHLIQFKNTEGVKKGLTMIYEKQLLFLCLVDLGMQYKMDCMSDQNATPCTDLCQCVHTHLGGSSLGLRYCSAPSP